MRRRVFGWGALMLLGWLGGCSRQDVAAPPAVDRAPRAPHPRIGVLLVSHGSRSPRWREMVGEVDTRVRARVLAIPNVASLRSAFMEYTEPSIATQLEALDAEGLTDVIVVPLLLTVSGHSFDDIPVISGQREDTVTASRLAAEGIRIYAPRARVHMTPLLDFTDVLRTNVERRVRQASRDGASEGVVLVAYGDEEYDAEWTRLFEQIGAHLRAQLGVPEVAHAWCGHLVHYDRAPTRDAIARVLRRRERALVIPILVAVDERFQFDIIGGAVGEARTAAGDDARVYYLPDAVLPEPEVDDWVVRIVGETATRAGGAS